jgi:hypothetical protein
MLQVAKYADAAARTTAVPSPAEGMLTYLDDINQFQGYAGSSWSGLGGMELIKTQTVGTAVSSVTVTGAFSAQYENYRVVYTGGVGSTAAYVNLVIGNAATAYYAGLVGNNFNGTQSFASDNNATRFTYAGASETNRSVLDIDILQPFITKPTMIRSSLVSSTAGYHYTGMLLNTTSYTDFTIGTSAGTITGGTIYVYGLDK